MTRKSTAQSAPAQEPVARVEKYTGDLKDMAIIVWLGPQPAEGTLLYLKLFEPSDSDLDAACEAAYWRFDARHKGYNEWRLYPQSERDAFKAEGRMLARGFYPVAAPPPDEARELLLLGELQNIVNAKRFDREAFSSDTEFADWAQSRARHTLAIYAEEKHK